MSSVISISVYFVYPINTTYYYLIYTINE